MHRPTPEASGEVDAVAERRAEAEVEAQRPGGLDRDRRHRARARRSRTGSSARRARAAASSHSSRAGRSGGEHEAPAERAGDVDRLRARRSCCAATSTRRARSHQPSSTMLLTRTPASRDARRPHGRGPPPRACGTTDRRGRCRPRPRTRGPRRASTASSTPRSTDSRGCMTARYFARRVSVKRTRRARERGETRCCSSSPAPPTHHRADARVPAGVPRHARAARRDADVGQGQGRRRVHRAARRVLHRRLRVERRPAPHAHDAAVVPLRVVGGHAAHPVPPRHRDEPRRRLGTGRAST